VATRDALTIKTPWTVLPTVKSSSGSMAVELAVAFKKVTSACAPDQEYSKERVLHTV
jgi:hypothetical protein